MLNISEVFLFITNKTSANNHKGLASHINVAPMGLVNSTLLPLMVSSTYDNKLLTSTIIPKGPNNKAPIPLVQSPAQYAVCVSDRAYSTSDNNTTIVLSVFFFKAKPFKVYSYINNQ